jgi:hypothetical protein
MLSNFYVYQNEDQINADLKCAICLDPFQSPLRDARCGHTFCFQCVKTWLKEQLSCPICRQYFTKFVSITDGSLLRELDYLLIECKNCNETNIQRGKFTDHITHECSKRIVINQDESNEENLEERLNYEYVFRRMNAPRRIRTRHRQNFSSIPTSIIIISGVHLLIYLLLIIPVMAVMYIFETISWLFLQGITCLIRFIKLQI